MTITSENWKKELDDDSFRLTERWRNQALMFWMVPEGKETPSIEETNKQMDDMFECSYAIAKLAGRDEIGTVHIAEAIQYKMDFKNDRIISAREELEEIASYSGTTDKPHDTDKYSADRAKAILALLPEKQVSKKRRGVL